ncbi:UNVERIFIED_CONTAM: hypothetical protein K2H54_013883 [Gekko kuhli]
MQSSASVCDTETASHQSYFSVEFFDFPTALKHTSDFLLLSLSFKLDWGRGEGGQKRTAIQEAPSPVHPSPGAWNLSKHIFEHLATVSSCKTSLSSPSPPPPRNRLGEQTSLF